MCSDSFRDARAYLDRSVEHVRLTVASGEKDAAAMAVAAQVQQLDPTARPASPEPRASRPRFARTDIRGLLADPGAAEISLEQAQQEFGCFLTIFPPSGGHRGLKIAIKDIFRFDDHMPTAGLARAPGDLALPPSPLIARLRAAGGQVAATTKLSPWCYLPLEVNEMVAPPRNPLGAGLLVGGSSSGSAVAVASGAVQVALGSDTGGSIRIPAALCGVYGFKPSKGSIPEQGAMPLGITQDTIGVLAASPFVLRSVFDVLTTLPEEDLPLAPTAVVGIPQGLFHQADSPLQRGLERMTNALQVLGIASRTVPALDLPRMNAAAGLITGHEAAAFHGPRMVRRPDQYPQTIRSRLLVGLAVSDAAYRMAQANRAACLLQVLQDIFARSDWILAPVINRSGLKHAESGQPEAIGKLSVELLSMNRWVNLLGLPSICIPVAGTGATPSAVQIVGAPRSDRALLALACALHSLLDPELKKL